MVQIAGKYQLVENRNLETFLQGAGVSEAQAKVVIEDKGGLEIKVDGNKITLINEGPRGTSTIVLGGEYEDTLANGIVVMSVATLEGGVLKISSKALDSESTGSRTYTATESGLEVVATYSRGGETYSTTRIFKRI